MASISVEERVKQLKNLEELRQFFREEFPDGKIYREYPDDEYNKITAAIGEKFCKAGMAALHRHVIKIFHADR